MASYPPESSLTNTMNFKVSPCAAMVEILWRLGELETFSQVTGPRFSFEKSVWVCEVCDVWSLPVCVCVGGSAWWNQTDVLFSARAGP